MLTCMAKLPKTVYLHLFPEVHDDDDANQTPLDDNLYRYDISNNRRYVFIIAIYYTISKQLDAHVA